MLNNNQALFIQNISQSDSEFDGDSAFNKNSRIPVSNRKEGFSTYVVQSYEFYRIEIVPTPGMSKGTTFYVENKIDSNENKILITDYGYVESVSRFSLT